MFGAGGGGLTRGGEREDFSLVVGRRPGQLSDLYVYTQRENKMVLLDQRKVISSSPLPHTLRLVAIPVREGGRLLWVSKLSWSL